MKNFIKYLYITPLTPEGRKMRIERLIRSTGEERDICAGIIYTRDALRELQLSDIEIEDLVRIGHRLERGEITMPADRKEEI